MSTERSRGLNENTPLENVDTDTHDPILSSTCTFNRFIEKGVF